MKKQWKGYLFIMPWLIGLLAFTVIPMLFSLYISFTEWPILKGPTFIFLDNYVKILKDPMFYDSLWVTVKYVVFTVIPILFISLFIAVLLNAKIRFRGMFRTIFYLPAVLPSVAVSLVWALIFNADYGLINNMLRVPGIYAPNWLGDPKWALAAVCIMSIWSGCSTNIILFLAGLQGVSRTYYEAAELDGANAFHKLKNITIPLVSPVIFFNLIMLIINSFQVFSAAMMLTKGGPADATRFYVLYLYDNAFSYYKMGYASALAWLLFLIIMGLNLFVFKTSGKWVYYEGGE
ncbi:MAG: sugar ABC transporter permease [Eubacteriales bacterium]|nr:sugar ABC transporter permease [Eubacteriales bacterium]